jgi:2TM domain
VPKTYSREEADEILRRALSQQSVDGINHDDLVAAAREVGIPEAAIEAAAGQLGEHRVVKQRVEQLRRQKRRAFVRHLVTFLIVNGGIFLFDYFDGGPWFFQYVLIVWGIILLLLGIRQLAPEEAGLVRRAERELEKERRRADRERRRLGRGPSHPGGVPGAAKEFEQAVQEGANALLSAAARAIRDFQPVKKSRYRADDAEGADEVDAEEGAERKNARRRPGRI